MILVQKQISVKDVLINKWIFCGIVSKAYASKHLISCYYGLTLFSYSVFSLKSTKNNSTDLLLPTGLIFYTFLLDFLPYVCSGRSIKFLVLQVTWILQWKIYFWDLICLKNSCIFNLFCTYSVKQRLLRCWKTQIN